jgi:hypothetical protein
VVEALFAAYFTHGRDIGDPMVLADIAEAAGMERLVVLQLLSEGADKEPSPASTPWPSRAASPACRSRSSRGKVAVVGAESPERIVEAIDQAAGNPQRLISDSFRPVESRGIVMTTLQTSSYGHQRSIVVAVVLFLRLRPMTRERRLKLELMWIMPALMVAGMVALFLQLPPHGMDWVWLGVIFLVGASIGWCARQADPDQHRSRDPPVEHQAVARRDHLPAGRCSSIRFALRACCESEASTWHINAVPADRRLRRAGRGPVRRVADRDGPAGLGPAALGARREGGCRLGHAPLLGQHLRRRVEARPGRARQGRADTNPAYADLGQGRDRLTRPGHQHIDRLGRDGLHDRLDLLQVESRPVRTGSRRRPRHRPSGGRGRRASPIAAQIAFGAAHQHHVLARGVDRRPRGLDPLDSDGRS